MTNDKMRTKIAGLLAKAERTDNEHERETYLEHAERLMVKWGIEVAELEDRGKVRSEEIIEERFVFTGSYSMAWVSFGSSVAHGMGNLRCLQSNGSGSKKTLYVIGHESDVERFQMLLTSLQLQVMTAQSRWWKTYDGKQHMTGMQKFKARRQFIASFGDEVGRRLKEMQREEVQEASTGTELVLADRGEAVNAWVSSKYPRLGRSRGWQASAAGSTEGRAAGREASLGEKSVGGRKAIG